MRQMSTIREGTTDDIDPAMAAVDDNVLALQERVGAPLLARIAYFQGPHPGAGATVFDSVLLS